FLFYLFYFTVIELETDTFVHCLALYRPIVTVPFSRTKTRYSTWRRPVLYRVYYYGGAQCFTASTIMETPSIL
uniref:Uncharacterized protein n=1 Tax=Anopheles arabiensis TaxID=7173 RepID=A0A182IHJ2_ANOAR